MTNKLVFIINSLKVPKIKKILLYEMKFLVPNYSFLQNPWLGGLPPSDPCSRCPLSSTEFVEPPPPRKKIPGHATAVLWVLSQTIKIWNVNTTLCCYFNLCGWFRTARNCRLIIILPDKQMYQQCSTTPLIRRFCESQRLPGCCGEKFLAPTGNRNFVPWLANL